MTICPTCNGHGLIGGFDAYSAAPGYIVEPCPDCNLKPCPFCGGSAKINKCIGHDDPNFGGKYIECQNCHVCTPLIFLLTDDVDAPLREFWNRRLTKEPPI